MNQLALTNVERVEFAQTQDAAHVGLGNTYADIQEKYRDLIGQSRQEAEGLRKEFLQENTGDQLAAAGRTGRSADRMSAVELGNYLAQGSRKAYQLTQARRDLSKAGAQARAQARQQQMQAFAQNNIIKNPDIAPPKPVMQNVGLASFRDALSIATSGMQIASNVGTLLIAGKVLSDRRFKENIKKIGESISGLSIYKFNYIGQVKQYIGTMADEVLKVTPEAAILGDDGFYRVNYDLIDVNFKEA